MSKQWLQIVGIWVLVLFAGLIALLTLEKQEAYLAFAALAGGAIALVSIEHLISAKAKDTVRQQVYVSAGSFAILSVMTLWLLLG